MKTIFSIAAVLLVAGLAAAHDHLDVPNADGSSTRYYYDSHEIVEHQDVSAFSGEFWTETNGLDGLQESALCINADGSREAPKEDGTCRLALEGAVYYPADTKGWAIGDQVLLA